MTIFLWCHSLSNINMLHVLKLFNLNVNGRVMEIVNTEQALKLINFVNSLVMC
jgi:hypothetical protein